MMRHDTYISTVGSEFRHVDLFGGLEQVANASSHTHTHIQNRELTFAPHGLRKTQWLWKWKKPPRSLPSRAECSHVLWHIPLGEEETPRKINKKRARASASSPKAVHSCSFSIHCGLAHLQEQHGQTDCCKHPASLRGAQLVSAFPTGLTRHK